MVLEGCCGAGALNVPFTDLLEGGAPSGVFKSVGDMKAVFDAAGVDIEAPVICSCGSGATGAVLSLAAYAVTGELVRRTTPCRPSLLCPS